MWGSIAKHRDGVGYFSDPLGKPSLFAYWRDLLVFPCGPVFNLSKRPSDPALAAVEDSADGVTVSLCGRRDNSSTDRPRTEPSTTRSAGGVVSSSKDLDYARLPVSLFVSLPVLGQQDLTMHQRHIRCGSVASFQSLGPGLGVSSKQTTQ